MLGTNPSPMRAFHRRDGDHKKALGVGGSIPCFMRHRGFFRGTFSYQYSRCTRYNVIAPVATRDFPSSRWEPWESLGGWWQQHLTFYGYIIANEFSSRFAGRDAPSAPRRPQRLTRRAPSAGDECKKQVDGFPKARFKSFKTIEEAKVFCPGGQLIGGGGGGGSGPKAKTPSAAKATGKSKKKVAGAAAGGAGGSSWQRGGAAAGASRSEKGGGSGAGVKRGREEEDLGECGSRPGCAVCHTCGGCHSCGGRWATGMDLELYFDGGARGNPGVSGAGAVVYSKGEVLWRGSKFVGAIETNNTAEYEGLIMGLRAAKTLGESRARDPRRSLLEGGTLPLVAHAGAETWAALAGGSSLLVRGDSKLVLLQVDGTWKVNKAHLEILRDRARSITPLQSNKTMPTQAPDKVLLVFLRKSAGGRGGQGAAFWPWCMKRAPMGAVEQLGALNGVLHWAPGVVRDGVARLAKRCVADRVTLRCVTNCDPSLCGGL